MFLKQLTLFLIFAMLPFSETFSQEVSRFQFNMKDKQKRYYLIKWLSNKTKKDNIKIIITGPNKASRSYTPSSYQIKKTSSRANNMTGFEYKIPKPLTKKGWGGKGDYTIEITDDDLESNFMTVSVGPRVHWTLKILPIAIVGAYFGYQFLIETTSQSPPLPGPPEPN